MHTYDQSLDVSHLKVFGAMVYTYIHNKNMSARKSLHQRVVCLVQRPLGVKAHKIYLPYSSKIVFSRSIKFDEESLLCG